LHRKGGYCFPYKAGTEKARRLINALKIKNRVYKGASYSKPLERSFLFADFLLVFYFKAMNMHLN
jgi:hypothetical protein